MKILLHVLLSKIGHLDNGPETLIENIEELISPFDVVICNFAGDDIIVSIALRTSANASIRRCATMQ